MNFESLAFSPDYTVTLAMFFGGIVFAVIGVILCVKIPSLLTIILVGLGISGIMSTVFFMEKANGDERDRLNEVFASNLIEKYDIESMSAELSENPMLIVSDHREVLNVVVTVDGTYYEFLASADIESGEPTLIDAPIKGGATDVPEITAESLLK